MRNSLSRALAIAVFTVVGASAFAQLSINGYYRVGEAYNGPSEGDGSIAFQDRIRLNLSFAAPDDMYGFKARLQADSSGTTSGLLGLFSSTAKTTATGTGTPAAAKYTTTLSNVASLKYGQAYVKFLEGMLKLTAGKLDVTDYMVAENTGNIYLGLVATDAPALKGSLLGTQSGNMTGTILQVWPIENLSAAVTMRADGMKPELNHFGLDAYYMVPGIGKALLASQIGYYSATLGSEDNDIDKSFVSLGFSYTGFPGLTATAAYRYNGSVVPEAGEKPEGAHGAIAIIEYNLAPFFANVSADFDFTNSHSYVELEAAYTIIPQIKVRAYGAFTEETDSTKGGNTNIKLNGLVSKALYGADLVFPVGKAEAMIGLAYGDGEGSGDVSTFQIPILLKANF